MCWFIHYFSKSERISYHQGRKQATLIACNLHVLSFVLTLTCKTMIKKSNMSEPPLKLPGKIPHLAEEQLRHVKLIHRSMWRQTQPIYVLIRPLLLQKQTYLISSGSKAKVSHIMLFPFLSFTLALTCKTGRKRAISQNRKSNVQSETDCS